MGTAQNEQLGTSTDTKKRVDEYKARYESMKQERAAWEPLWKEVADLVSPSRSMWDNRSRTGQSSKKTSEDIYDSHAIHCVDTLVRGLVGYNVGPRIRWADLKLSIPWLNELPYVSDWLEEATNILYKIFANSNFYIAAYQFLYDLATIGTAHMIIEDPIKYMELTYDTRHTKEVYIAENDRREIDYFTRDPYLTGRQMLRRYGDSLPKDVHDRCRKAPFDAFQILHIVHPNNEEFEDFETSTSRPWVSVEIDYETDQVLWDDGFYEAPIISARWLTNSDETYGRSPTISAFPEIKRVNEIGRTILKSAQLSVEKPLMVPDYMRGALNIVPMGLNYYKRDNRKIEPIELGSEYPVGIDVLNRMYQNIDDHYYADLFEMLTRSERQMTAREINERMGEKVALLAGPLTGLNNEFLKPVVLATFHKALRNGWMPLPPIALRNAATQIDVDFVGPLAQAQQRYHQAHNVNSGLAVIGAMAQIDPMVVDMISFDDLAKSVAKAEGFPEKAIREEVEVRKIRAERVKQQQAMQQMEQLVQMGQASQGLNQAPQKGSVAQKLIEQVEG